MKKMRKLLVIGLGGTGIKTLIHVKKALTDREQDGELPANVRLLGFDTTIEAEEISDIGLWAGALSRKGSQKSVVLANNEYTALTGDLRSWVNGPNPITRKPHLSWFNRDFFSSPSKSNLLHIASGAGMYRQIGRLAFFNHASSKEVNAYKAIEKCLNELQDAMINVIV